MRKAIMPLIIILIMLFSVTVSFAAQNPNVIIANPVAGTTIYSSNLLISVKITKPTTIKVNVYKQMKTVTNAAGTSTLVAITYEEFEKAAKDKAAGKEVQVFRGVSIVSEDTFTSTNNLSFYTKKLENVAPAVYKVKIDTIDAGGKVIYSSEQYVNVKDKSAEARNENSEQTQPGAVQFLQNLLKSIFGS